MPRAEAMAHRAGIGHGERVTIETLIQHYGLLAIFVGAGIEGEAVVVTGGIAAHRGLVPVVPACLLAALGSFLVDQAWFAIGRRFQDHRWVVKARAKPAFARAVDLLERRPTGFILAFRFIYGMRTVSPIAIGVSKVPLRTFLPLNAIAAAIWGPAFTLLGYFGGHAIDPLLDRFAGKVHIVVLAVVGLAVFVAGVQLVRYLLRRRSHRDDAGR